MQMIQQNPNKTTAFQTCFLMPLAIAAIVIAAVNNDGGACSTSFTVDLESYLYAAGGVQAGILVFSFCVLLMILTQEDVERIKALVQLIVGPALCSVLFYFVWGIIGLNMYANQMSGECRHSDLGTMVFAWALIMIIMLGFLCYFICCAAFLGGALAISGLSAQDDDFPL